MNPRSSVVQALRDNAIVESVAELRRGHVRLRTPIRYPDGSKIDLFIHRDPTADGAVLLTDFGTTANWLSMLGITMPLPERRQTLLRDILETGGVQEYRGALQIEVRSREQATASVLALATACLRFSDLMFTRKTQEVGAFRECVEDSLVDVGLRYDTKAILEGIHGRKVEIDFLVRGATHESAVLTLSAKPPRMRDVARSALAKVFDLRSRPEQRVVVYDDHGPPWPEDELERLAEVGSWVCGHSEREVWSEVLAA